MSNEYCYAQINTICHITKNISHNVIITIVAHGYALTPQPTIKNVMLLSLIYINLLPSMTSFLLPGPSINLKEIWKLCTYICNATDFAYLPKICSQIEDWIACSFTSISPQHSARPLHFFNLINCTSIQSSCAAGKLPIVLYSWYGSKCRNQFKWVKLYIGIYQINQPI